MARGLVYYARMEQWYDSKRQNIWAVILHAGITEAGWNTCPAESKNTRRAEWV